MLTAATGVPVLGVVPWLPELWLDSEDALDVAARRDGDRDDGPALTVAVVRFPRISNFTDVDALAVEPGVDVRFADRAAALVDADLVVLPGTRSTFADLGWLRRRGMDRALAERHRRGRPVLGICGGFQMLGVRITDPTGVETADGGSVDGLALLPVRTHFTAQKTLGRPRGEALGHAVSAYEIHHGEVTVAGGEPFLDGCRVGTTWGTLWHGAFESDDFRRAFLRRVAADAGREDWAPRGDTSFAERREARIDALADAVERHLDTAALLQVIATAEAP
jgi:adenosylcobyric acid synthase